MSETKDTNPKDLAAIDRLDLSLIPTAALVEEALAMHLGALKYGRANWRDSGVRANVYIAGAYRHLRKFEAGEDMDPESLASHLGHVRACCGILLDAMHLGNLNDDRRPNPDDVKLLDNAAKRVQAMKQMLQRTKETDLEHA